ALEVMMSADDYDAEIAERCGWINRALPAASLDDFVRSLAHRIANWEGTMGPASDARAWDLARMPISAPVPHAGFALRGTEMCELTRRQLLGVALVGSTLARVDNGAGNLEIETVVRNTGPVQNMTEANSGLFTFVGGTRGIWSILTIKAVVGDVLPMAE